MAGQQPSRRQVLQALSCAATAAAAGGFSRWTYAFAEPPQHHHSTTAPVRVQSAGYKPVFFSAADYVTVLCMAELILPNTAVAHVAGRPVLPVDAGATDAGVAEFIDFMVSGDPALQPPFKAGLQWLAAACAPHAFTALDHTRQTQLLERLAFRKNFREDEVAGQVFFAQVRRLTLMGFYTSRIGLESLDYPGLRFYAESPAVPRDTFLQQLGV